MYNPPAFATDDPAFRKHLMQNFPFATVISAGREGMIISHLPLLHEISGAGEAAQTRLMGHFSRANAHWKEVEAGAETIVIFQGEHTYISPNFYPRKAAHHKAVPTWNYLTLHCHGRAAVHPDPAWLRAHVSALSDQHEANEPKPWALSEAPEDYVAAQLRGIVGFSFLVTRFEAKAKLSQNRAPEDQKGVVTGLKARVARGARQDDATIAKMMETLQAKAPQN